MRGEIGRVTRRLIEAVATLGGLILLTFLLLKVLPGTPFDLDRPLHPEVRARFAQAWGTDASIPVQLGSYFTSVLHGNLGWSLSDPSRTVFSIIRAGAGQTLLLNVISLLMILVAGFFLAMAPRLRVGLSQRLIDTVTTLLISMPSLFLGPLLIWIFALKLDLLPVAFLESPASYLLPVLTLSLRPAAALARILTEALSAAGRADYMRTARAKGLSPGRALWAHALKNSLLPVLGYGGTLVATLFSASFIVEVLFAVQGLGTAFVLALGDRDYPVVLGLALFEGMVLIFTSVLIDGLIHFIDPRLRDRS